MKKFLGRQVHGAAALFLGFVVAAPHSILAQDHVVPPAQIQNDVAAASASRQRNEQQVRNFLSSKEARQAMKSASINPNEVTNAVGQLNNADLARLAARSAKAQQDFAAGNIDNHDLLVILVAIAVLILIIVAVH
jgi:hypothetical protein